MTPNPNNRTHPAGAASRGPVQQLAQWNVVLINDKDHSYNYVTTLLQQLFAVSSAQAVELATQMARTGRVVCMTTHREYAEFKREQIQSFGKDTLVDHCTGSMSAALEACE